jgi:AAA+ ATPase superfamily predicted ATPase
MDAGFPAGNIVPGRELVGREELVRSLVNRLQRGENLILTSPRRTGKTFVAMDVLMDEGIVEKVDRGRYAFGEKMFADYVRSLNP